MKRISLKEAAELGLTLEEVADHNTWVILNEEKRMKVRELVARLMECDPEAMVMVYSDLDEGASFLSGEFHVTVTGDLTDRWYVKADWPDARLKSRTPLVIIK